MMMMMLYSGKIATIIIEIVPWHRFGRTAWSRDGGRSQHEETYPLLASDLGQYMGALPQTSWWWWWWWLLSGPTCGSLITQLRLTYRSHLTSLTIDQHAVFAFLELQVNLELFRFGTEASRPKLVKTLNCDLIPKWHWIWVTTQNTNQLKSPFPENQFL